jgi:formylglycine-generating enzyme required for sulfatase activity
MHNGQPTGAQDTSTTEDGSYYLNGATLYALAVTRKPNATWVIPSEDEWYKVAYHKNDDVTGNYWDYPTGTNEVPNNGNPGGDTGNSANFWDGSDYTIGSPYYRTNAGFFGLSDSPYGTFDQGGNVWEWNEAIFYGGSYRGVRGGSFDGDVGHYGGQHASFRNGGDDPTIEYHDIIGFRVAEVPEPATILMFLLASVGIIRRRKA